jgi:GT2 family glycosyltransferase
MQGVPELSIVIVNFNVKDYLSQCLRSIYKSKYNFIIEIIVVDNNSVDNSVEFVAKQFPEVTLISLSENKGFAYANNEGFKIAKGRYLLALNPDTYLQEDTLQTMFSYMESHPEVGIAGCKVLNPDGTLQLACRRGFPTPWASFTKLFGLQSLFPNSKLFGRYNQTFRNPNETYFVDAISGAFMFIRREVIEQTNGFDTSFFMYGEDLDLCYRASQLGWKVAYVHSTSIIHYKGQSTKRSSIDETVNFYQAMEIFARRHYGNSFLFLAFIGLGIRLRKFIARIWKYKTELFFIAYDLFTINLSLLIASLIRFGSFFSFPSYAYPTVFIALSFVIFASMVATGEYFERRHNFWGASFGLMIAFFVLSSLTYFFNEFAFSRGVLLLTIGFAMLFLPGMRVVYNLKTKVSGKHSPHRLAFIGDNEKTKAIIQRLEESNSLDAQIVGLISTQRGGARNICDLPFLGSISELQKILSNNKITEVIITDSSLSNIEYLKSIQAAKISKVRFHFAQEYEDIVAARLIDEVAGLEPTFPVYNFSKFRYQIAKRLIDIALSLFFLTFGIPLLFLLFRNGKNNVKNFVNILVGKMTFVGTGDSSNTIEKKPLISIVEAHSNIHLSEGTIYKLKQFYLENYSPLLDIELLLKYIRGRK